MSSEVLGAVGHVDNLDADAVCVQCSTVNPEGTFICKTCGNNLRDQRSMRMVADQMMDGEGITSTKRQWLPVARTILLILIVLYVALNLSSIESYLVRSQLATVDNIQALWTGTDSAIYAELAVGLAVVPSPQELSEARNNPVANETIDGKYVIVSRDRRIGLANVSQQGTSIYFVAQLLSGQKLRGKALASQKFIRFNWESAGYLSADLYTAVAGVAQRKPDGTLEIFGRRESVSEDSTDASYTATGYPLPIS